jgi:hypothetical protein
MMALYAGRARELAMADNGAGNTIISWAAQGPQPT